VSDNATTPRLITLDGKPLTGVQGVTFTVAQQLDDLDGTPVDLPPMEPVTVTRIYHDQAYQDALDAVLGIPNLREVWFYHRSCLWGLVLWGIHFQADVLGSQTEVTLTPVGPIRRSLRVWRKDITLWPIRSTP
jgi:hypothetical protein